MKTRRKFNACPNCGHLLDRTDNYCPQCGQENDDKNVSANILFSEFMGTYFSLDSSFFRSIKPFLINPGFLTNQFNDGKRKSFANPVRLYLILSIFYFFMVSIFGMKIVNDEDTTKGNSGPIQINRNTDSTATYLTFSERDSILEESKKYSDSKFWESDTLKYQTNEGKDSTAFILNRINWQLVNDLKNDKDFSDQEVLDSMKLGELGFFENYIARQVIRINRADTEAVLGYLFKNLPLMMLAAIPLFALMLKIVYLRTKTLYVKHIIHALHLHSFAYLMYGLGLILVTYFFENSTFQTITWFLFYSLVFVYSLVSFKKVYGQGWFKSFIKFMIVGFGYSFLILAFFIIEAAVSFLLY